ncbi:ATP synthase F1 subunit epsilon, partial [Amylibacter sp.]|nr:ATP synthase F1 subunit epsilon [Amylibacter sp.]
MATIQFDLVSPEKKLASLEVSEIQIPGSDGDLTAMAEHAPLLTTLRPGLLSVKAGSDLMEYIVTGGFVEISTNVSVLAEEALPRNEVNTSIIEELINKATVALEDVT